MNDQDKDTKTAQESLLADRQGRRRFLGAGTVAAPFILTMVSRPALGITCFTPSRSLSKNTSISQQGKNGECTSAESPGNYKAQQDPTKGAYHWPGSVKPSDPFHPTFTQGTNPNVTSFTITESNVVRIMTFGEALSVNAPGQVHFHIIGAYLNKLGGNGAVIPDSAITVDGIKKIWTEYAMVGYYEPTAGVKWYAAEIVNYLISNGIVK